MPSIYMPTPMQKLTIKICSRPKGRNVTTFHSRFMNITANLTLNLIRENFTSQLVFLCIDDTMVSKFGRKFEEISKLELAASTVREVMSELREKKNVIILCSDCLSMKTSYCLRKRSAAIIQETAAL